MDSFNRSSHIHELLAKLENNSNRVAKAAELGSEGRQGT